MKKLLPTNYTVGLLFSLLVISLQYLTPAIKSDDFRIGIYFDPVSVRYWWGDPVADSIADRYYAEMDTFGVDYILGGITVPQVVNNCATYGIDLYPCNTGYFPYDSRIRVTDTDPFFLENFVYDGRWFEMEADGTDHLDRGYIFIADSATGIDDAGGFRTATIGVDSPGYLFRKVDDTLSAAIGAAVRNERLYWGDTIGGGVSGWDTLIVGTDTLVFNDSLFYSRGFYRIQYSDADDSCNDTCVIGKIVILCNFWILTPPLTILNDTLIYDENGDTLSIDDEYIVWGGFDLNDDTEKGWHSNGLVRRIESGGDTTNWGYLAWSVKDIRPYHFSAEDTWDTVSAWYFNRFPRPRFYWTGRATVSIDDFFFSNQTSYLLKKVLTQSSLAGKVDSLYEYLGIQSNANDIIPSWYPYDEPYSGTWYPLKHFREIHGLTSYNPGIKLDAARGWGGGDLPVMSNIIGNEYFPDFLIEELGTFFNADEIDCDVSPYSYAYQGSDSKSIQYNIDFAVDILRDHYERADSAGMKYVPILYPGGLFELDTIEHVIVQKIKEPYGPDVKLQANLCVAYGASEIAYYPYMSYGYTFSDTIPKYLMHDIYSCGSGSKGSCPTFDTSEVTWPWRTFIIYDSTTNKFIKVNDEDNWFKWNAAKEVHSVLDSLAYILNGREFIGAGRWDEVESIDGTIFSHISSVEYGDTAAFVHVATFLGADGKNYYMLINRRTWPGPEACQCPENLSDTQHVIFDLNIPGDFTIRDAYKDSSWLAISGGNGVVTDTILIPPGEALFLTFERYHWKEHFTGLDNFPENGTHYISGDVTIEADSSFTIHQGNKFYSTSKIDSTGGGAHSNRIELIVEGHLEAIGTVSDSIIFKATTDTAFAWYGIRVVDNGSANIQYADIKYATTAYRNTSTDTLATDTIMHVKITDCFNGIDISYKNVEISDLKIVRGSEHGVPPNLGTAIHLELNDYEVSDCYIENVKTGLWISDNSSYLSDMTIKNVKEGVRLYNGYATNAAEFHNIEIDSSYLFGFFMACNYSKAYIDSCEFNRILWYGLWNPFDNGSCRVEHTLFHNSGEDCYAQSCDSAIFVYSKSGNIDLGSGATSSCGKNKFPNTYGNFYPSYGYLIYNSGSNTTYAGSCCWGDYCIDETFYDYLEPLSLIHTKYENNGCIDCSGIEKLYTSDFGQIPDEFSISQNYPNPFNPITAIDYAIPEPCHVKIMIYNILGQEVITLVDSYHEAAYYSVTWSSNDESGNQVASGIYYYQLISDNFVSSKKMLVLK